MDKPDIVEIISQYVPLRRAGRELVGRCCFHADKNPSFYVNPEKQLFLCRACGEGGDVITFMARIEGVPIAEILGRYPPEHRHVPKDSSRRRAAQKLAGWLNDQDLKIGIMLRDLSRDIALAEELDDSGLLASFARQWDILVTFHDDLENPGYAEELWTARDSIEAITQWAEPEPLPEFPPLTAEYWERIRAAVRGEL
jgi:CHC2 zinc finger